jgi:hypothetical protein
MRSIANSGKGRFWRVGAPVVLLCLALALLSGGGVSQQSSNGQIVYQQRNFPQQAPFGQMDPTVSLESEKRLNMINAERQKTIVSDAGKLLALATELNHQIAKSNPGELSAEQMRKVVEIEKLAHSVRDKMVMPMRSPSLNDGSTFSPSFH